MTISNKANETQRSKQEKGKTAKERTKTMKCMVVVNSRCTVVINDVELLTD
jgi:hypothetical protein